MLSNLVDYPRVADQRPTYSEEVPHTRQHDVTQSVTTAPTSRAEDQKHRLQQYLATMSVRTVCFVLAIVTDGWLRWVFAAGAIVLPFIAVVAANAVAPRIRGRVQPVVPTVDRTPTITDRSYVHVPSTVRHPDDEQGERRS